MAAHHNIPTFGLGACLCQSHFREILHAQPDVPWFEFQLEDVMGRGGLFSEALRHTAHTFRCGLRGECLNIGSTDPLDTGLLSEIRHICEQIDSPWYADDLAFCALDGRNLCQPLPLPWTQEATSHIVQRVRQAQESIRRPVLLRNIATLAVPSASRMSETEFLRHCLEEADCLLMLDLTAVIVNSHNHKIYKPKEFLQALPPERIAVIHISSHDTLEGDLMMPTFSETPPDTVLSLLQTTLALTGPRSIAIEWKRKAPSLMTLAEEVASIRPFVEEALQAEPESNSAPRIRPRIL